jgi:hypothetical protein
VARERTVKGLAKRIELTYYHKLSPFRRWWRHLCIAATVLAVLWVLVEAVRGDQRIYTSGPVATAHRMFETDCARCHINLSKPAPGPSAGATASDVPPPKPSIVPAAAGRSGYFARVSDGACLACHDGTIHHENMAQDFTCATCHLEHKVGTTLARMSDRHCTACHADLQVKGGGKPKFEAKVTDLAQHPEIALFRKEGKDPTQIKLNHRVHIKTRGRSGPDPLGCASCHVEDDAGKYMKAMSYDRHCKACHPLTTSDDIEVPHQRPELIQGFLLARAPAKPAPGAGAPAKPADKPAEEEQKGGRKRGGSAEGPRDLRLASLFAAPAVTTDGGQFPVLLAQRKRGGEAEEEEKPAAPSAPAAGAGGGAPSGAGGAAAAAKVKALLEDKRQGCPFCHVLQPGEPFPTIVPPKIPTRWQQQATFDHRAHRPLACAACHEKALQSEDTADILLPKLQTCRECHREGGGARAGCVECHLYHDRTKERSNDGPFPTVPRFVTAERRPAAAPAQEEKKPEEQKK